MIAGVMVGRPWAEPLALPEGGWREVPVRSVFLHDLWATQDGVYFHAIIGNPQVPHSGDRFIHVVRYQDKNWILDGHHRVVRAALRGDGYIRARVLSL